MLSSFAIITVSYDWDKNRLIIEGTPPEIKLPKNKTIAKKWCKKFINNVRTLLGVNWKTGIPFNKRHSELGSYFTHEGFVSLRRPKGIGEELDNITKIRGKVIVEGKNKHLTEITCEGPLVGRKIFFYEKEE